MVRLKGGDPFVFGRGYEELQLAQEHGITTQVVPGISSSIAAAGAANIPITLRNVSRSFWVLTGTTSADQLSKDMLLASQSTATIVIMMGYKKLSLLTKIMLNHMVSNTPITLVWNATRADTDMVLSTIGQIENDLALKSDIPAGPATIIVGDVVRHAYPEYYGAQYSLSLISSNIAV